MEGRDFEKDTGYEAAMGNYISGKATNLLRDG